jgi:hypothetical protein
MKIRTAPADTQFPPAKDRHLILIDAENLAATGSPTKKDLEMVKAAVMTVLPDFGMAQCIVACSHHAARAVAFAFPQARHLWRSGRDGADLALLDVLKNERVDQRFGRVTICSGDGIFAACAAQLASADVNVTVVALKGHLAARLELAARTVVQLTNSTRLPGTASGSCVKAPTVSV